jgi:hypothetical protein
MAKYLINIKKLVLKRMDRDKENPNYDVYLFDDTQTLRDAMREFTENKYK